MSRFHIRSFEALALLISGLPQVTQSHLLIIYVSHHLHDYCYSQQSYVKGPPPSSEMPNCLYSSPHNNTAPITIHCPTHIAALPVAFSVLPHHHMPTMSSLSPLASLLTFPTLSSPQSMDHLPTPLSTSSRKELYTNAMAIHSTHGSGLFGHLAIIMADANYTALTGQAFIAPIHPGDTPIHAVAATNAQIMETNHQFLADHSEHKLFLMVSQELKKQLLAAIATIYLLPLQHETLGFTTVLCAAMLTHLSATYGVITPDQLKDNCDKLEAPWNPNDPIEGLWKCIHECQHLATVGGDPITALATVHSILDVLEKTEIFADAIHDW